MVQELLAPLGGGFTHFPGPCVATFHRVFRTWMPAILERILTGWLQAHFPAEQDWPSTAKHYAAAAREAERAVALGAALPQAVGVDPWSTAHPHGD